jgi:hypothetical protein
MNDHPKPETPPEPVSVPVVLTYVPKFVAHGEGRVYWPTADGLPLNGDGETKKEA